MATSLDEQRVEEQEAWRRTTPTIGTNVTRDLRVHMNAKENPFSPTFQSESVVTHSVTHVLPHHIFDILQRLGLEWGVEARPLGTVRTSPRQFGFIYFTTPGRCRSPANLLGRN